MKRFSLLAMICTLVFATAQAHAVPHLPDGPEIQVTGTVRLVSPESDRFQLEVIHANAESECGVAGEQLDLTFGPVLLWRLIQMGRYLEANVGKPVVALGYCTVTESEKSFMLFGFL